jgi:hypothetical protein
MTRSSGFAAIALLHGVVSHKRFLSPLSFLAGLRQPPPPTTSERHIVDAPYLIAKPLIYLHTI